MKAAKVSELKAGLSKYLARVKRGEQIVITERGRTIAKIIPVLPAEADEEERIRELERLGIASAPKYPGVPPEYWTLELPKDPEGLVLKGFLRDREEDR
jgi:prevent-host-death family protein